LAYSLSLGLCFKFVSKVFTSTYRLTRKGMSCGVVPLAVLQKTSDTSQGNDRGRRGSHVADHRNESMVIFPAKVSMFLYRIVFETRASGPARSTNYLESTHVAAAKSTALGRAAATHDITVNKHQVHFKAPPALRHSIPPHLSATCLQRQRQVLWVSSYENLAAENVARSTSRESGVLI
jgi:hypothetical protein